MYYCRMYTPFFKKFRFFKNQPLGVFGSADNESDLHFSKEPSVPRYTMKMSTFLNIDFCNFIGISEHIIIFIVKIVSNIALRESLNLRK